MVNNGSGSFPIDPNASHVSQLYEVCQRMKWPMPSFNAQSFRMASGAAAHQASVAIKGICSSKLTMSALHKAKGLARDETARKILEKLANLGKL